MPPSYWKVTLSPSARSSFREICEALGEERRLAQALGEHAVVVVDLFEDVGVGQEGDGRAGGPVLVELLPLDQLGDRIAALEALVPVVAVHVDVELEPLAERVDDRDADAVQTAGDLVAGAAELAAGVQHGEHDGRRPACRTSP